MILYFNDYKLIYIITMMGKINNIPVLNEDVIRLVVLNEEIIGYIYPRRTSYVVALEIKPGRTTSLATSVNKQCMVLLSDKVRLATEQDFDDFHICFDGFRNNTMYCYNQLFPSCFFYSFKTNIYSLKLPRGYMFILPYAPCIFNVNNVHT